MNRMLTVAVISAAVLVGTTGARPAKLAVLQGPRGGWQENQYYEFQVPLQKQNLKFVAGDDELLVYTTRDRGGLCFQTAAKGVKDYSSVVEYRLNATIKPATFATMDDLYRYQEGYANSHRRDPETAQVRLGVRVERDAYLFYANGVFVHRVPRKGGVDPTSVGFDSPTVIPPLTTNATDAAFVDVDLSEQLNTREWLDLSMSWNTASCRLGYTACHARERWPNPLAKTPFRYQFRVPADDYDAMHVVCTADPKRADTVPRFTVQFHRWTSAYSGAGRPMNFPSGDLPNAPKGEERVIPLSGDLTTEFGPDSCMNFELTKDVEVYRTYPDPLNHSWHGSGLPSSAKVKSIRLHRAPVKLSFDPAQLAGIFGEEESVTYRIALENRTAAARTEKLDLESASWDGEEKLSAAETVTLAPGEAKTVEMTLKPARFGFHRLTLKATGRTYNRSFVRLRKRDYTARPFAHKGLRFGTWSAMASLANAEIDGKTGFDTFDRDGLPYRASPEYRQAMAEIFRKYGMRMFGGPGNKRLQGHIPWTNGFECALADYKAKMPKAQTDEFTPFREPSFISALAEPGGIGTGNACFPEYWGEPENAYDYRKLDEQKRSRYDMYERHMRLASVGIRQLHPGVKVLIPHGSWNFMIPYLQNPETRNYSDGVQMDFQFYTRLPEEQMHQTSLHSIYYLRNAWKKYRTDEPLFVWGEGPDVTQVYPGGSSEVSAASHRVRISMLMAAYGCNYQLSWACSPVSHGENHCSGGLVMGKNAKNPELLLATFAAWTRLTRDATHESFTYPGSTSAFCQNFRNHRTGGQMRAIWTIRGTREFTFDVPAEKLTVYDPNDNIVKAESRGGKAVIRVGEMPVFVFGAEGAAVSAGENEHADAKPKGLVKPLGRMGELFGSVGDDADPQYVEMMPDYIRRFPAKMDVKAVEGGNLSVGLPKQPVDRKVMPYYTSIRLKKPVVIPGKAKALLLDVKAASDWGRVVYVLKDAAGHRWYSCGRKGEWNADDMEGDSVFCFDGWRTLRFELPANAPWDGFRNVGFTNWGSDTNVEAKVALPVALERIFVERRSGVMYGDGFRPFETDTPVELGALAAEYEKESDMTDLPVRQSRIAQRPYPEGSLPNPIAEMAKKNELEPGRITGVRDPDTWFDGTRGVFSFEMPTNAVSAEFWMSKRPDGKGALLQASNVKKSPSEVGGFLADTEFYAFLIWKDKAGNASKPSEPFKFKMIDHFGHQ